MKKHIEEKVSEELLELVKQFKDGGAEDKLLATVFADPKTLEQFRNLTYKKRLELEERV